MNDDEGGAYERDRVPPPERPVRCRRRTARRCDRCRGAAPAYLPISAHLAGTDHEALAALVSLHAAGAIMLHSAAAAAAGTAERPVASRLARALIASGQQTVVTLDHQMLLLEDPGARAFLMLMDGTRDGAALQRDWAATPYATEIDAAEAQRTLARFALIAR